MIRDCKRTQSLKPDEPQKDVARLPIARLTTWSLAPQVLIFRLTLTSRPKERSPRESWEQASIDPPKCETAIEKPNCEALAQIFGLNPPLFF